MRFFTKKYRWGILYAFLLISFTLYVLLDTFVIKRVYTVVPTEDSTSQALGGDEANEADDSETLKIAANDTDESNATVDDADESNSADDDASDDSDNKDSVFTEKTVVTDNTYSDPNISITITEYRENNTSIYVADIQVTSAEYLQTAFAQASYGRNVTEATSQIASSNQAILAINGDYYGSQTEGYVIRNGVLYRENGTAYQEDLVIYKDGSFEIITEGQISAAELLENRAEQVLSFGPALVMENAISVTQDEEVGKAKTSNPRTAIGIIDELHYVFVVSDGRTDESEGLTLYQLAEFMQGLGVENAYNLDGGGSSTMYFNGQVINNPTSNGKSIKERGVSDIVYIGY